MKFSLKTVVNYIAVFTIFSGAWTYSIISLAQLRLFYLIILFVFLFLLPASDGLYFSKNFVIVFFIIIIISLYNILIEKNTVSLLLKQVLGIFGTAFFFYLLIRINEYDIEKLFKIYLKLAFLVALIGIIQEVSYFFKFQPGYDYQYLFPKWGYTKLRQHHYILRVTSILSEPANFCSVMIPAFFVSWASFLKTGFRFQKRWKSMVIIISFFLSFSLSGYIGAFFVCLLLAYNCCKFRYVIVAGIGACLIVWFLYSNLEDFRMRIANTIAVVKGERELEKVDESSYALLSNAMVAYFSFTENPLFGSGLGSHQVSFRRNIGKRVPYSLTGHVLNEKDAASLFLRLLSETGILGIMIFFLFIFSFFISKHADKTNYLWVISNAILSLFFLRLFRTGHYFTQGFFFFIWVYYFAKIKLKLMNNDAKKAAA